MPIIRVDAEGDDDEAGLRAILVDLEPKDAEILQMLGSLQKMERRLQPLMQIYDALLNVTKGVVFDGPEDAEYEIKLDREHSIILEMKDGEFGWRQTCNCAHDHND